MLKPIAIIGSGGHAKVIADIILSQPEQWQLVGYFDVKPNPTFEQLFKTRYLGQDQEYPRQKQEQVNLQLILGVGRNAKPLLGFANVRQHLIDTYSTLGAHWGTVIASSALISPTAKLGANTAVMSGAIINACASIGEHSVINTGAIIEHDVVIGSATMIGPGAKIGGGTLIGSHAMVGIGAQIRDHIHIGDYATVGMGATVVAAVPDGETVIGTPAEPLYAR